MRGFGRRAMLPTSALRAFVAFGRPWRSVSKPTPDAGQVFGQPGCLFGLRHVGDGEINSSRSTTYFKKNLDLKQVA